MKKNDLTVKLMLEKASQLTGHNIEIEEMPYKYRVTAFNPMTYQSEELATVCNRRELMFLFNGLIRGAEMAKESV